jgi:hypothetical protein
MCYNRRSLHLKSEKLKTSLEYFTIELLPDKKLTLIWAMFHQDSLRKGLRASENIECWLRNLIQLSKTMLMKGKPDEPCCGLGIKVVSNEGERCGVWQLQYSQMKMFSKC